MRVPVLIVLPRQEPLMESAQAVRDRRVATIPLESTRVPMGITIDPTISAVALGTARGAEMTLESLQPETSEKFAVRGFVEVDDITQIPTESEGHPIFSDPKIAPFITCVGTGPVGASADVATSLRTAVLHQNGCDGDKIALAIMDTGINLPHLSNKLGSVPKFDAGNSWSPAGSVTLPGQYPIDHGTMCAFDALIAAPKATLLDYPILAGNVPGGSSMSGTLSVALLAYAQLLASWAVSFSRSGLSRYRGLVVNNSWGMFHPSWDFPTGHPGRFCDNPNHPFHQIVGALARAGADILFAAGNCGAQCPDARCNNNITFSIMGSSAHPDVLTVAGCDTNDLRVGYSSQGPAIPGMFQNKPDITAYTHFLGSEAFGVNSPDSGTSAACPVAAGCVAALRTKIDRTLTPPSSLFQQIMTTARKAHGQTGWNGDYGHGILDPVTTAQSLGAVP